MDIIRDMKVGLRLPQTGKNRATKENIVHLATQAESAGFDSLWVLERLIWPVNPQDPYPGTKDGKLPEDWQYVLDPLETLTFVAAHTKTIALGTSIIDMLFHNPVILAKRFATLDVLSSGRAIAGFGIGWSKDEYHASNIPFKDRGKRANEYVQLIRKIWTDNVVEMRGNFYNIPPSKIEPKPIQKPHPPIYLGGYSQNTFARIANHANGWICVVRNSLSKLKSNIDKISEECYKVNRDPKDIQIAAILYPNITDTSYTDEVVAKQRQLQGHILSGTVEQVGMDLLEVKKAGVDHAILNYNRSEIDDNIDKIIEVSKQLSRYLR